jgi:hypothetical protein
MTNRFQHPFRPIASTAPGFSATFDNTSTIFALQSTGLREWSGPGSQSIRIADTGSNDYHMIIGSSDLVVSSSEGTLIEGGTVEVFSKPTPSNTHIAFVSSTDVTANVTLGMGN